MFQVLLAFTPNFMNQNKNLPNLKKLAIMTVLYESFQSHLANKEKQYLYYPRVVRVGNVTMDQIASEIANRSSLSSGDVKNTIDNLIAVMRHHLLSSESVTLDGFGSFRLVIKAKGNGVMTEDQVSSSQCKLMIRFSPAFTRKTDGTVATRSLLSGVKFKRVGRLSNALASEETVEPTGKGETEI